MTNNLYRGYFQDISRQDYVVLFNNKESQSGLYTDLVLSGDPVTIEYENSEDLLYKPVKLSGATIRLITTDVDEYYFDLYSNNPQKIEVEIRQGLNSGPYNLAWHGFVTPSLYTQGFEYQNEEIEIDCIDGLSALKYYKYTSINEDPGYHSFMDIIRHILNTLKRFMLNDPFYQYLFFQKSTFASKADASSGTNILRKLYVNEAIFFDDEAKYDTDGNRITDKDDTMLEVLEKIMTYLGMTMYAEGNNVWIIDYDAISTGVQTDHYYCRTTLSDNTDRDVSTMIPQVLIYGDSYAENGQSISLDKVYNKVTVVDKFDKIDKLLPDLYDDKDLTEIYPNDTLNGNPPKLTFIWPKPNDHFPVMEEGQWCYYKVMTNNNYNFYAYDDNGNQVDLPTVITQVTPNDPSVEGWAVQEMYEKNYALPWMSIYQPDYLRSTGQCACIMKSKYFKHDDYPIANIYSTSNIIVPYFNYDNYLLLQTNEYKKHGNKKSAHEGTITRKPTKKLVSITPKFKPPFLSGNGRIYLVITGSCFMEDRYNIFGYDSEHKRKSDDWSVAGLVVSLRIGDKWWSYDWRVNGAGSWVNSETTFRVPLWNSDHDHWIGQELKVKNNIPYTWGINKEGWAIPLPDNVELETGELEVCLWTPKPPTDDGETWDYSSYLLENTWIKDFNIELHVIDEEKNKVSNDDSDTCYTNLIDVNNIEELDDIEFDLCTFDNKTIAYNCVYVNDGSVYNYLDKVYNPYVSQHLDQEYDQLARFEELYCCRVANQYNTPKVKLEVNLNMDIRMNYPFTENILNKVYIVDSKQINLRDKNIKYTLIEKA